MEIQGRALQLRNLATQQQTQQMAMEQAQRTQQQEAQLNDLYRGNVNPDGTVNRQGLLQGAAQAGLGSRIPGIQKGLLEADKAQADVGHVGAQTSKLQFETAKAKLDMSGAALNSLLSKPDVTHDDVLQTITSLVQQGVVAPDQGAQMARAMPGNPAQLRPFLMQKGLEVMDASKRMDLLTPKTSIQSMGGADQVFSTNQLTGQVTPGQSFARSQSPDSIASNATAMRGQNMTDQRSREATAATMGKPFEVTGPDGQPMLVQQDRSGKITPVQGFGPKTQSLKPIPATVNEAIIKNGQASSQIDRALTLLEGKNVDGMQGDPSATGWKAYLPNGVLNRMDPQGVDARAVISDIGSLKIHDRSGAAVTIGESPRLMPFIPLSTDDASTVKKKLNKLRVELAGESSAMQDIYSKDQGYRPSPARTNPAQPAGGDVPADIAAILSKHGSGK
jgi:hypothetical protein